MFQSESKRSSLGYCTTIHPVRFPISALTLSRSNQDIVKQAVLEVSNRELYDVHNNRAPVQHGPLDGKMGTSSKTGTCETCSLAMEHCNGHFGHVRLALPVFHIGYLKMIIAILQDICKVGGLLSWNPVRG